MATVVHMISGANVVVTEDPAEVADSFNSTQRVTVLTRGLGDDVYVKTEQVTHWHVRNQQEAGGSVTSPAHEDRTRTKPRFGRSLPKTP